MISVERDGGVTFRVYLMHAQSVEIVGSFTDTEHGHTWLNHSPDGWWAIRLRVPEGEHEFSYLVDDRFWVPDYAAAGLKRTPNGQLVSLLHVSKPPASKTSRSTTTARTTAGRQVRHELATRPAAGPLMLKTAC